MENYDELFYKALEFNDYHLMKVIPKSDFHNHIALGGNRNELGKYNIKLDKFKKINKISDMQKYIKENLSVYMKQLECYELFMICTVVSAINDGVKRLVTSVDCRFCEFFNYNVNGIIDFLNKLRNQFQDSIEIEYDIGISRKNFQADKMHNCLVESINSKFFRGIDLYGDEMYGDVNRFKEYYNFAQCDGLKLKAHVGEFGDASKIVNTIKVLGIEEIQHGINIVESEEAMKFAKEKNVIFNICPTSNYLLGRVNKFSEHPIKTMVEFGLNVTINSDDNLLFDSSVSKEYLKLYRHNVLSKEQLNIIRKNSLKNK